jgi:hypothetical protein
MKSMESLFRPAQKSAVKKVKRFTLDLRNLKAWSHFLPRREKLK